MSNLLILILSTKKENEKNYYITGAQWQLFTVFSDTIHIKQYHCQWNCFDYDGLFLFATCTFCALDVFLCYANIGNLACNLTWNTPVSIIHGMHSKVIQIAF